MRSPKGRLELTWMGKDMALIPTAHGKYDYECTASTTTSGLTLRILARARSGASRSSTPSGSRPARTVRRRTC